MAARKRSQEPQSIDRTVELAAERIQASGGCPLSKLGVPKAMRPEVLARLEAQGFEITKSNVRQPVTTQLRAALASGAFLAMKSLKAHVVAATLAEAKAAAVDLVRAGQAHLVLRAGAPTLVPADADVLREHDLGVLARSLDVALKQTRKAAKAKATLLRDDSSRHLEPFVRGEAHRARGAEAVDGAASAAARAVERAPSSTPLVERVPAAVEAAADARTGLAFVPTVVRSLSADAGVAAVLEAVREAAQRGLIELRPESGLGRLASDEQALCVAGPEGSRLSWARPVRESDR